MNDGSIFHTKHVPIEKDRVNIKVLFQHLQNSSFTLQVVACNLLFYDAINGSLMMQNHLLEMAISLKLQYL